MHQPFPPPLGARIAGRFDLLAPLRGEGAVQTFLVHDQQTRERCALSLFDPAHVSADGWAEFARIVTIANEARVPGLILPSQVPQAPPDPPHVLGEAPEHRDLDRLHAQDGRISWQRALTIGERIAGVLHDVLAATHVAHRALTPSRCIIDASDEVALLDYGVAEIELADDQPDESAYRAPEQRGGKGDHRSDIHALATIIYKLISGECPTGAPPPRLSAHVLVPEAVDQLLEQALAHDPAERPADLAAMRAAMRALLGLPPAPGSATETPAPPSATNEPLDRSPPPAQAHSPAILPPLLPLPPLDLPPRRHSPASQDSTLILSSDDAPPTARSPAEVPLEERTVAFTAFAKNARAQPHERTEVLSALPARPRAPQPDKTEVLSALPTRQQAPQLDKTEVLSALPAHQQAPQPDKTEVLSALPAHPKTQQSDRTEVLKAVAPARDASPQSPEHFDDEKTVAMPARKRALAPKAPDAPPQAQPTVITTAPPQPPPDPPVDTPPLPPPPPASNTAGPLRTTLIAVNVAVGLTLLAILLTCALS